MNVSDLSRFPQTAAGKKAEVLGIGISNLPLVDFLLQCGVLVTVRDRKSEEQLGNLPKELKAKGIAHHGRAISQRLRGGLYFPFSRHSSGSSGNPYGCCQGSAAHQ